MVPEMIVSLPPLPSKQDDNREWVIVIVTIVTFSFSVSMQTLQSIMRLMPLSVTPRCPFSITAHPVAVMVCLCMLIAVNVFYKKEETVNCSKYWRSLWT